MIGYHNSVRLSSGKCKKSEQAAQRRAGLQSQIIQGARATVNTAYFDPGQYRPQPKPSRLPDILSLNNPQKNVALGNIVS